MTGTRTTEQLEPHGKLIPRRQCIPILYTKGTHYDVGFDVVSVIWYLIDFSVCVRIQMKCYQTKKRMKVKRVWNSVQVKNKFFNNEFSNEIVRNTFNSIFCHIYISFEINSLSKSFDNWEVFEPNAKIKCNLAWPNWVLLKVSAIGFGSWCKCVHF